MKLRLLSQKWGLLIVALALCNFALAQRSITGTVTDANSGEPLIGANILVVGTGSGTITDLDGSFSLEVPDDAAELEISYTGYTSKTVALGASNILDVALSAGEVLDEVLVIGYGSVKKDDLTGSVQAVDEKKFNQGALVSPDKLITGKIAGVQITSGAEPGSGSSIRIRGGTSVSSSNEPLYVIDGVPIDNADFAGGRNPLNFLNPSDIATFTVLKDASATAIYGSRGANGVIMITTKRGTEGAAPRITYDGFISSATLAGDPPVFNADEFRNLVTFQAPQLLEFLGNANTNWFDEVTRTAIGHSHNISITGGGQSSTYRVSAGFQDIEGVVQGANTQRTNVSLAFTQKLMDDQLVINTNLKTSFTNDDFDPNPIGGAWDFDPTQPVRDPSNVDFAGFFEYGQALTPRNPVSSVEQIQQFGNALRGLGNIEFSYAPNFLPGLTARLNLGADLNRSEYNQFQPTTWARRPVTTYDGEVIFENNFRSSQLLETYLNYKTELNGGMHRLDVTAGYSYQDFANEFTRLRAFDLASNVFGTASTAPAEEFDTRREVIENRLISFFGRAIYTLDDKYTLTATVRRDGSSRFSETNRWGIFPSAAFAWRLLEEDFMSGLQNTFSDLKLRVGWGITGNQEIGNYRYLPIYEFSDARARYQFGDEFVSTARPNGYDSNLKWEETTSLNIGLDFGFGNGRVNGTIEYYQKNTNDLLFTVNVPAGTNLTDRVLTNIGEVQNSGVELTLNTIVMDSPDLNWDVSFNAAFNSNEVLAVDAISDAGILTGDISGGVGNQVQIIEVGQAVNSFYLYQQRYGADGSPLVDGIDHNDDGVVDLAHSVG
ncbi:MAG: SusC/RagA family TonB-linked outer membrane protein [Bacteroidota bacterium]